MQMNKAAQELGSRGGKKAWEKIPREDRMQIMKARADVRKKNKENKAK